MSPDEYFSHLRPGQRVDYDGAFGAQCVDLARDYCQAIGAPQFPKVLGAGDLVAAYSGGKVTGFVRVDQPLKGCLAVHRRGQYGHVAVIVNTRELVEQNGYTQTGVRRRPFVPSEFEMYLLPTVLLR